MSSPLKMFSEYADESAKVAEVADVVRGGTATVGGPALTTTPSAACPARHVTCCVWEVFFFLLFFYLVGVALALIRFPLLFFRSNLLFCLYASLLRPTLRVWSWIVFYHHFSGLGGRFFGLKSKTKIMEMSRNQFNGTRSQPSIGNATFGTSVGRGNFVVKVRPGEISWPIGMMSLSLIYQSLRIVSARSTSQRRRRLTTVQWASGRLTTTTTTTIEVVAAAFGCLIGVPVYEC